MRSDSIDTDKYADKIARYTMMDNAFMNAVFQNNLPAVQCLVSAIITDRELEVVSFTIQKHMENLYGHSTTMDIYAKDQDGALYDIEIQQDLRGAHPLRLRYYSSLIDVNTLENAEEYKKLPEKYVIFITDGDWYKKDMELHHFTMQSVGEDPQIDCGDKQHYIFIDVNSKSDTDLGRVLHDIREPDPNKMYNEELATRAKHLKISQEGRKEMTTVTEEIIEEGRIEGRAEGRAEGKLESITNAAKYLKKESTKSTVVKQLMGIFGLTESEAQKYYDAA